MRPTMDVIGIMGNPRKGENTGRMIGTRPGGMPGRRVSPGARSPFRISGSTFNECMVCKTQYTCPPQDEFIILLDIMKAAQGIILRSPVLASLATSEIKAVVGRRPGHNLAFADLLFFFLNPGMIIPVSFYLNFINFFSRALFCITFLFPTDCLCDEYV